MLTIGNKVEITKPAQTKNAQKAAKTIWNYSKLRLFTILFGRFFFEIIEECIDKYYKACYC